ncbi:hypothetical protein [Streptomyces sp. NPDC056255]|uniref:hypothetical protein n=1 Tax=Streptomyces sp. NPDC056255 TaxID=3345764 RepID=UPI0035DEB5DE
MGPEVGREGLVVEGPTEGEAIVGLALVQQAACGPVEKAGTAAMAPADDSGTTEGIGRITSATDCIASNG